MSSRVILLLRAFHWPLIPSELKSKSLLCPARPSVSLCCLSSLFTPTTLPLAHSSPITGPPYKLLELDLMAFLLLFLLFPKSSDSSLAHFFTSFISLLESCFLRKPFIDHPKHPFCFFSCLAFLILLTYYLSSKELRFFGLFYLLFYQFLEQ